MVDAGRGRVRPLHDHARQHGGLRRALLDPGGPPDLDLRAPVGRDRLRAHLRGPHAQRREARRHVRPAATLHRRPGDLHGRLPRLRPRDRRRVPDRRPGRPGSRLGADQPGDTLDHHRHVPAAAARDGDRHLGRRLGDGPRDRAARRRSADRAHQLELDLLHQHPGRHRRHRRRPVRDRRVARRVGGAAARPARADLLRASGSSRSRTA